MTDKERFRAVMDFEPGDRTLFWEQGFWGGTVDRWYAEGMVRTHGVLGNPEYGDTVRGPATPIAPGDRICHDIREQAGLDLPSLRVPVELYMCPAFEETVLADRGDQVRVRDPMGIEQLRPKAKDSVPHFVGWPVSGWDDWEQIKAERLDPNTPGRFPDNWSDVVRELNAYGGVVAIGGHPNGFFGAPRYLMGEVALLMGFLDQPDLVRAIVQHLADLWSAILDRILQEVRVDCLHIWEDMSFKNGPLISPDMFADFLVPAYRQVTDVAKSHGVDVVLVDTDGDCTSLIPHFMDGGVTGLYPFEVQAGMDVQEIRKAFPKLQILGGIDKTAMARDTGAIDAELERRMPGMIEKGGYVPMGDHQIPPDVPWENYLYYRRRLSELCG